MRSHPIMRSCFFHPFCPNAHYPDPTLQNLGAPDPNVILPTVTALTFLYVMETGAEGKTGNLTPPMRVAMRGLPLFMVPLTMFTPAGVFVYWSVSNSFSLVQTAVLKVRVGMMQRTGLFLTLPTLLFLLFFELESSFDSFMQTDDDDFCFHWRFFQYRIPILHM